MITKKKRWIMQDRATTTFTTPTMLAEMYDAQMCQFGYRNKTEVLTYLACSLWNKENGQHNSRVVERILQRATPERASVLLCCPRVYRGLCMTDDEKDKILSLHHYGYLSNLINAVMEAFLSAAMRDKRSLRKEMHVSLWKENISPYYLKTYVSNSQYDQLCHMAQRSGVTFVDLMRTGIDAVLIAEGLIPETWFVPFELQDAIQDSLRIEGFTLHRFSRGAQVQINIHDELRGEAVRSLIRRYEIPGTTEFLRRVILFLLESQNIPDLRTSNYTEESEEVYFDENEMYANERLSRKDFSRSIYQ